MQVWPGHAVYVFEVKETKTRSSHWFNLYHTILQQRWCREKIQLQILKVAMQRVWFFSCYANDMYLNPIGIMKVKGYPFTIFITCLNSKTCKLQYPYFLWFNRHGETPNAEQTTTLVNVCDHFIRQHPLEVIGVHCTHGFNRTGFLIMAYLIEKMDWRYRSYNISIQILWNDNI